MEQDQRTRNIETQVLLYNLNKESSHLYENRSITGLGRHWKARNDMINHTFENEYEDKIKPYENYINLRKSNRFSKYNPNYSPQNNTNQGSVNDYNNNDEKRIYQRPPQASKNADLNFEYLSKNSSDLNRADSDSEQSQKEHYFKNEQIHIVENPQHKRKKLKKKRIKKKKHQSQEEIQSVSPNQSNSPLRFQNYGMQIISRPNLTDTGSTIDRHIQKVVPQNNRDERLRRNEILNANSSATYLGPNVRDNHQLNEANSRIQQYESFKNFNGTESYSYAIMRNKNKYKQRSNRTELLPSIPKHLYYNS